MATPGKHTSSIAVKQAWESILQKRVSGAFDEKCRRDLKGWGGWKIRETYRYESLVSPHHPSTQTIFIGLNWKKHCWQIKYLPEHSGLLCAAYTLDLWPRTAQIHIRVVKGPYKSGACYEWNFGDYISCTNPEQLTTTARIVCSAISNIFGTDVREPLCQRCCNDESRVRRGNSHLVSSLKSVS